MCDNTDMLLLNYRNTYITKSLKLIVRVSIITVTYNAEQFIEGTIKSVLSQTYPGIEFIVIDGNSIDGTKEILNKYSDQIDTLVFEDDSGLYDAMNKGIFLATGDIIGFLNADDLFANERVIENVIRTFNSDIDAVYGDLLYVDRNDDTKIVRSWKANDIKSKLIVRGWIPPHPTFYVRRQKYNYYGSFDTSFRISSDYDLMVRLLHKCGLRAKYLPQVIVHMRDGGVSNGSFKSFITKFREDYLVCKKNGIKRGLYAVISKKISKIPQLASSLFLGKL